MAGEQDNAAQLNDHVLELQLGSIDVNRCTFHVWLKKNYHIFWQRSTHDGICLGKRVRKVFRQILLLLKVNHDQNLGYGNLRNSIKILENDEVIFCNKTNACPAGGDLDVIHRDILDFKHLVEDAVKLVNEELQSHLKAPVSPHVMLTKFYELYNYFDKYCGTIDNVRKFSFYVRNNPLFLDTTGNYMLIQKIIDLRDYNRKIFGGAIRKYVSADLSNWHKSVCHIQLLRVLHYENGKYMWLYSQDGGVVFFFRCCFGHAKDYDWSLDNGKITELILDDLPFVIPTLFLGMIQGLDNFFASNVHLCGSDLIDFLKKEPSVFS